MGVLNTTYRVGYALIIRDLLRRRELKCLQNITHYFSKNFYGCVLRQLPRTKTGGENAYILIQIFLIDEAFFEREYFVVLLLETEGKV